MKITKFVLIYTLTSIMLTTSAVLCLFQPFFLGEEIPYLFLAPIFSLMFSVLFCLKGKLGLISFPIMGGACLWFITNFQKILSSVYGVANRYILAVNNYNENIVLEKIVGASEDAGAALIVFSFVAALIITAGVFIFNSNIITGFLVVTVIFSGVFTSVFPPLLPLATFAAGLIICTFVRQKESYQNHRFIIIQKHDKVYKLALVVGLLSVFIAYFASEPLNFMALKYKEPLRENQLELLKGGANNHAAETSSLQNEGPYFWGEIVLEVKSSVLPEQILYIKDGAFGNYTGNSWGKVPSKELLSFIDKRTSESTSRFIFDRPYKTLLQSETEHATIDVSILANGRAAMPYNSLVPKDATLVGDGFIRSNSNSLSFNFFPRNNYILVDFSPFEYDFFAIENYLEHPPLASVKDFAENISTSINTFSSSGIPVPSPEVLSGISNYFSSEFNYTLDTKPQRVGADFVDNFLTSQKEGFCQHFASATVLVLRAMGYPARYATGYAIPPSYFNSTGSSFTARVPDYLAHAWTEIYTPGFGWIPFDTTPGSVSSQADAVIARNEQAAAATATLAPTTPTSAPSATPPSPTMSPTSPEKENPLTNAINLLLGLLKILVVLIILALPFAAIFIRRIFVRRLRYHNYKKLLSGLISMTEFCTGVKQGSLSDSEFIKTTFEKIKLSGAEQLANTAEKLLYSKSTPNKEDLDLIIRMYDRCSAKLKPTLSLGKKILFEYLYCY